jgi:hypothetical protein
MLMRFDPMRDLDRLAPFGPSEPVSRRTASRF